MRKPFANRRLLEAATVIRQEPGTDNEYGEWVPGQETRTDITIVSAPPDAMTMWDYRMRKMDIAWELASRIIPEKPQPSGAWTEADYIAKAQKVMKEAAEAVDAVFTDRGGVNIHV